MSGETVSIAGLDKAAVFAALYNRARPQGAGFMHYNPTPMTVEQARQEMGLGDDVTRYFGQSLSGSLYFDYVRGRVMKVNLEGDEFSARAYDRDNGQGAAAAAIEELRQTGSPNGQVTQAAHHLGKQVAAQDVYEHFHEGQETGTHGGTSFIKLGLSDLADQLLPRVRAATEDTSVDDNGE